MNSERKKLSSSRANSQLDYYAKKGLPMKLPSRKSNPVVSKEEEPELIESQSEKIQRATKLDRRSTNPVFSPSIFNVNQTTDTLPFERLLRSIAINDPPEDPRLKNSYLRPLSTATPPSFRVESLNIPPATGDEENFKLLMNQSIMRMDNLREFLLTNRPLETKNELSNSNSSFIKTQPRQLDMSLLNSGVMQFLKSPAEMQLNPPKDLQKVTKADAMGHELILLFLEKVEILRLNEKLKFRIFDENKSEGSSKGLNTLRTHNERLAREVENLKSELRELKSFDAKMLVERNKELEDLLAEMTEELSKTQGEVYSLKKELDNSSFGSKSPFGNRADPQEIAQLKKEYEKAISDIAKREESLQRRLEEAEENSRRAEQTRLSGLTSNQIVLNSQRNKISELSTENQKLAQELRKMASQPNNFLEPLKNALQELLSKALPAEPQAAIHNAVNDELSLIPLIRKACNSPLFDQPRTSSLTPVIRNSNVVYVTDAEPLSKIRTDRNSVSPYRPVDKTPQKVVVSYQKVLLTTSSIVQEKQAEAIRNSQVTPAMNLRMAPRPTNQQSIFFAETLNGNQVVNILSDKSEREMEDKSSLSQNDKKSEQLSMKSEMHDSAKTKGNPVLNGKSSRRNINDLETLSVEGKARARRQRSGFKDDFDEGPTTDLKSELLRLKNKVLNLESKAKGSIRKVNDVSEITNNDETTFSFTRTDISPNTTRI